VKFKITTLEITVNENDETKEETEGTITYKGNRHGKNMTTKLAHVKQKHQRLPRC
jgi:hypothetical protein